MKLVREWLEQAETEMAYGEEAQPPEQITKAPTLEELDGYMAAALTQLAAARQVKTWIETEMIARIGDGHSVRLGDWFYRAGAVEEYKVREDRRRDFWCHVREHDFAERLFNPNQARKTGMRELGHLYVEADPETGEIVAEGFDDFRDDFLEVVERRGLQRGLVGSRGVPKYAETMEEGEIR